jgi:arylsulfatase B
VRLQCSRRSGGAQTPRRRARGAAPAARNALTPTPPSPDWTSQTGDYCDPALFVDLYGSDAPAFGLNNSLACSQTSQAGCAYEDSIFLNFTLATIRGAAASGQPLFFYYAPHNTHEPLEAPAAQLAKFDFVYNECAAAAGLPALGAGKNNTCAQAVADGGARYDAADKQCCFRQYYSAMTNLVDTHIGAVVAELKAQKMWANTLLVVSADNGGPIYRNGAAGANNYPLRGGKKSNFEGGVRVNTLVSGGFLPAARAGTTTEALMGIEDWYTTVCNLAGIDPADKEGEAAGLPPVDGIDLWPFISGANSTPPRTEVWLGSNGPGNADNSKDPIVQALIRADGYKVIWGLVIEDAWTGPLYPNATTQWCDTCPLDCGTIDAPKCLFNVFDDPTEHVNLAASHPAIVASMSARLKELTKTVFAPDRGVPDTKAACKAGADGWVRPFLP